MSGLTKAATAALIVGLTCFGFVEKAAAIGQEEEEGEMGEVPLYYLQLQDFTAAQEEEEALRPKILEYTVRPGDCLYTIATQFGTNVDTLVCLNNMINPSLIHPGECIEILTVVGCVHDVKEGETIAAIADAYGVDETVIFQANEISPTSILSRGERIIVPGGVSSHDSRRLTFQWPLQGTLTSGYGWRNGKFHYGIDLAAAYGTAFYAAAGGQVTWAGYRGSYGIMIEVDHGDGYRTRYGHAHKVAVSVGQWVKPGQKLGYVGLTGNTTGPHLHFEIHAGGKKVNPLQFLD
ncbi:MAG TPA: M23 family metallopeptidase [Bacillota bacterium]|jgi:murein DD-endopeptidase MepM/ murein hydrolase activator NlpD|nr:M23 family metallopeptidase [Bacillota bacterium]HPZ41319.1 M23 family metallopeptidase [Bacillota bacterium]HQD52372.1 M23 family metallopeptidase [Bacillota bacterium]